MADLDDISPHHGLNDWREQNEFYSKRMDKALREASIDLDNLQRNAVKHAAVSAIVADVEGQRTAWWAGHTLEILTWGNDDEKDLLNNYLGRELQKEFPGMTANQYYQSMGYLAKDGYLQITPTTLEKQYKITLEEYYKIFLERAKNRIIEQNLLGREVERCFLTGTMIDMWPVEAGLKPDAEGLYDEEEVWAKVWQKPIEKVTVKDWVLSFDQDSNLKPGRVKQTFENEAKIVLDFHGTFVTPAHVYYCAGGTYEGKFVPLIDILRDDGVVQHVDGSLIRASTGCEVGSEDDKLFWAFLLYEDENGIECVREKRQLRLGARWMMPNGKHFSMREYMEGCGIELVESGELEGYVRFKKTGLTTVFAWTLSGTLPSPEDFVLRRSQTTLEDIYRASEWESVHPQMPAPVIMDSGPIQPLSVQQFDDMPRNNPIGFQNNSPSSELKLNRKARKAQAARQRRTKKARQKADKAIGTLH